ncbi:MAG: apolipoprotein N-acyltransferase [Gammaproteobacteria bacterium]
MSAVRFAPALRGWRGDALALMSGAPLPLAFAPFGYYALPVLCFVGLLLALNAQSARRGLWRGYLFGVASFLGGLYWIHVSIHVFGGAPLGLALALMLALVLFLAVYPALFGWALNRWFPNSDHWRILVAAPALWLLTEWLRGWLFSGFGWLGAGYTQSDGPLAALLPVIGVYGATFALLLISASIVAWLTTARAAHALLVIPVVVVGSGLALGPAQWSQPIGDTFRVALVQGAVPQDEKWLPGSLQPTVDLYLRLTDEHPDADLVVWPEAAIPTARHNLDPVFDALRRRGQRSGSDYLIGAVEVDRDTGARLNTVVALGDSAANDQRYVKRHLVPYGEYFPVPGFVREWIRWMDLPYQDFTSGGAEQPLLRVAGQAVGVSICYEDVFGNELLSALPAASVLVNVSNDAWFGGSIAPHQHLQIARVRAMEAARMLLRGTNNGISAVISASGDVQFRSPQFEPFVLTAQAQGRSGVTPYSRTGNTPLIVGTMALLILAGWRSRRGVISE